MSLTYLLDLIFNNLNILLNFPSAMETGNFVRPINHSNDGSGSFCLPTEPRVLACRDHASVAPELFNEQHRATHYSRVSESEYTKKVWKHLRGTQCL